MRSIEDDEEKVLAMVTDSVQPPVGQKTIENARKSPPSRGTTNDGRRGWSPNVGLQVRKVSQVVVDDVQLATG